MYSAVTIAITFILIPTFDVRRTWKLKRIWCEAVTSHTGQLISSLKKVLYIVETMAICILKKEPSLSMSHSHWPICYHPHQSHAMTHIAINSTTEVSTTSQQWIMPLFPLKCFAIFWIDIGFLRCGKKWCLNDYRCHQSAQALTRISKTKPWRMEVWT